MLARHAEALYWTGRYVERAEDTARMLDVTYHGLVEARPGEEQDAWRELLEVLFLDAPYRERYADYNERDVTRFLVLEPTNPGSIVAAVSRARENARNVRDRLSTELWEAVNEFHLELRERDLAGELDRQPYALYRSIKGRCQMVAGVASETMARDDGLRFMLIGRLLERAEMTCRMLQVRYTRLGQSVVPAAFQQWVALLKSVSAFEAYLKEYRASMDPTLVLHFLLMSHEFPRSVLYCLRSCEQALDRLGSTAQPVYPQRLLSRVRANLEYRDVAEILAEGLDGFLDRLQRDIWQVAAAIDTFFFRSGADLALHTYEST